MEAALLRGVRRRDDPRRDPVQRPDRPGHRPRPARRPRHRPDAREPAKLVEGYLAQLPTACDGSAGRVCPGVAELLAALRQAGRRVLGLLTGNVRAGAERKLGHFGLWDYFACGGFGDDHFDRDDVARAALADVAGARRARRGPGGRVGDRRHAAGRAVRPGDRGEGGGGGDRLAPARRTVRVRPGLRSSPTSPTTPRCVRGRMGVKRAAGPSRTIPVSRRPSRSPGAGPMPFDPAKLAADVEAFCQELRPHEELCYVEHRFNDQVVPAGEEVRPPRHATSPPEYGGRGADTVTYFTRPRPHRPRGHRRPHLLLRPHLHRRVPDPDLGQRRPEAEATCPPPCRGEKILAFGLTEPDAGSNPLEMTTTYEKTGRPLRPQRRQVPHLQRRHRRRGRRVRLPAGRAGRATRSGASGLRRGHARPRASQPRT